MHPRFRRGAAAVVALAVAVAGFAAAVRAFTAGTKLTPGQSPLPPMANGPIWALGAGGEAGSLIYSIDPQTGEKTPMWSDGRNPDFPEFDVAPELIAADYDYLFSPDGSRVSFSGYVGDGDCCTEIFVMNADGSGLVQVTHDNAYASFPSWSPDGTELVYSSYRGDAYIPGCLGSSLCPSDLYAIDVDGTHQRRLTGDPADESMPSWSTDGETIAFRTGSGSSGGALSTMNADGTGLKELLVGPGRWMLFPRWSPDGSRILFLGESDKGSVGLWVTVADGTGTRQIIDTDADSPSGLPAIWSPDGTEVAYEKIVDGEAELWVARADGTDERRLATLPRYGMAPLAWRPVPPSSPTISPGPEARGIVTVPVSAYPNSVLVAEGSVWVSGGTEEAGAGDLVRLDPTTGDVIARIAMQGLPTWEVGGGGMAPALGSIWVVGDDREGAILQRVDPVSNELSDVIPVLPDSNADDVWADAGGIWILASPRHGGAHADVVRIDPLTHEARQPVRIEATWAHWIFGAGGSIWVLGDAPNASGGVVINTLYRIDPSSGAVSTITLPGYSWKPVVDGDTVWLLADTDVVRLDASTGTLDQPIDASAVCCTGSFVGDGAGGIWVSGVYDRHQATISHISSAGEVDAVGSIPGGQVEDWSGVDSTFDPATSSLWIVHYQDSVSRIQLTPASEPVASPS